MRDRLTLPLLAALGALVLVSTLFLSFYLSTSAYRSDGTGIVLPEKGVGSAVVSPSADGDKADRFDPVEITTQNVQQVVATMTRPQSYHFLAVNTLYYGAEERSLKRRQWFHEDLCRTDELNEAGDTLRHSMRKENMWYAWEADSDVYSSGLAGDFSDDSAAMFPTYETVIQLPAEQITAAGLQNLGYEPCIVVSATIAEMRCVYYISAVSGLLVQFDVWEGETLKRRCVIQELSLETPDASIFRLPDGQSLMDEE